MTLPLLVEQNLESGADLVMSQLHYHNILIKPPYN